MERSAKKAAALPRLANRPPKFEQTIYAAVLLASGGDPLRTFSPLASKPSETIAAMR